MKQTVQTSKDTRGAASVLVIFMLLVLVTLGAFAIASAHANYRLSRRAQEWNSMYYELDARGEELLAVVDAALLEAQTLESGSDADYFYFSNEFLTELSFEYPELTIYSTDDGLFIDSLFVEAEIKTQRSEAETCGLFISIQVVPPSEGSARYRIWAWREFQVSTQDEPSLDVWDGTF